MKPLEKGRRVLAWIGINFVDEVAPVTSHQKFARKVFPFMFQSVCIAMFVVHVITLLKVRFIDTEENFYMLMQFVFVIHGSSSFITLISCSRISIMFQGLTEIYEKCKYIWVYRDFFYSVEKQKFQNSIDFSRSRWTLDTTQRKVRVDLWTCPQCYGEVAFRFNRSVIVDFNFHMLPGTRTIWYRISISDSES